MNICGDAEPKDVYLAATLGGGAGTVENDDGIRKAFLDMEIPVTAALGSRLDAAIAHSLGTGGRGSGSGRDGPRAERLEEEGGGGGGAGACGNPKMRSVVQRARSAVDVFAYSWPAGVDDGALAAAREEVKGLGVALVRLRRSGARWGSVFVIVCWVWGGAAAVRQE